MILNPNLDDIKITSTIGLDLETNGVNAWENDILLISVWANGVTYVLERRHYTDAQLKAFFERIQESSTIVIGQNIKFDICFIFMAYGVMLTNLWDTMLASQVTTNGKLFRYSLNEIITRELGIPSIETAEKKHYQLSFVGMHRDAACSDKQIEYSASDVDYLHQLYVKQKELVVDLGLQNIMRLEHKLLPILVKMEVVGCRIDTASWLKAIKEEWETMRLECIVNLDAELLVLGEMFPAIFKKYLKKRRRATHTVYDLFNGPTTTEIESAGSFNYASSRQVIDLFVLAEQPSPIVKKDDVQKISAGADALAVYITEYIKTPLRKFITLLLKFREYEKLISTYGEGFLALVDKNGYIHTTYSQCFTKTARLSSRAPNLQNIPATDLKKDGYDIRQYFLPDPDELMLTCDMQGAEVRIAADYSGEEKLIDSILKKEDLHSSLASKSFSIIFGKKVKITNTEDMITVGEHSFKSKELRDKHKSVLFAKFYKGGAKRVYDVLSEYINLYHEEDQMLVATKISKAMDKELPKLSRYLTKIIDDAQESGMLRGSKLGRIRYFDSNVYGEAANYGVQNTNAEALKIAMIKLDEYFESNGYGRLVMNIHDEVVCSVKKEHAEEVGAMVKKTMSESLGWFLNIVPGDASVNITTHWKK